MSASAPSSRSRRIIEIEAPIQHATWSKEFPDPVPATPSFHPGNWLLNRELILKDAPSDETASSNLDKSPSKTDAYKRSSRVGGGLEEKEEEEEEDDIGEDCDDDCVAASSRIP